jgi:hypothetical protein
MKPHFQKPPCLFLHCFLLVLGLLLPWHTAQAQFIRQYGSANSNEFGKTLLPERNAANNLTGNFFLGGTHAGQTLIMRLDPVGNVLGQWVFKVSLANETEDLSELRYDRTLGSLLGCGLIPNGGVFRSYAFRFNLSTHTLTWAVRFTTSQGVHNLIDRGAITPTGAPYIHAFGMSFEPSGIGTNYNSNYFELNLNTGAIIPGSGKMYACSGSLSEHFSTEYDPVSNNFFSTGRWGYTADNSTFRPGIFKSGVNGTKAFSRTMFVSSTSNARLYGWDLVLNAGVPSVLAMGDFAGNSPVSTTFAIARLNPSTGAVTWARQFNITAGLPGNAEAAYCMRINNAGNYVVYGHSQTSSKRLFLLEITPTGTVVWGWALPSSTSDFIPYRSTNELMELNGSYYVTGATQNGSFNDIRLIRTNLSGDIPNCSGTALTVSSSPLSFSEAIGTSLSSTNTLQLRNPIVQAASLAGTVVCGTVLAVSPDIQLRAEAAESDILLTWASEIPDAVQFRLYVDRDGSGFQQLATLAPLYGSRQRRLQLSSRGHRPQRKRLPKRGADGFVGWASGPVLGTQLAPCRRGPLRHCRGTARAVGCHHSSGGHAGTHPAPRP